MNPEKDWAGFAELPVWIDPQLTGVVIACWCLGFALKRTPFVPDWTIIYAVTALAVVLVGIAEGWSAQSAIRGILCGAFAVYGHQLVKQTSRRD